MKELSQNEVRVEIGENDNGQAGTQTVEGGAGSTAAQIKFGHLLGR